MGDLGSIPGLGRSPGEENGYLLQYSGLENSLDCVVHGVTKSETRLSDFHFCLLPLGEEPWCCEVETQSWIEKIWSLPALQEEMGEDIQSTNLKKDRYPALSSTRQHPVPCPGVLLFWGTSLISLDPRSLVPNSKLSSSLPDPYWCLLLLRMVSGTRLGTQEQELSTSLTSQPWHHLFVSGSERSQLSFLEQLWKHRACIRVWAGLSLTWGLLINFWCPGGQSVFYDISITIKISMAFLLPLELSFYQKSLVWDSPGSSHTLVK